MINSKLQTFIDKRISQPTVILCFRILLDKVIEYGPDHTMTKSEIAAVFNKYNRSFGIQKFKTDYVLRQTGVGDENALREKNKKFYIDKSFLIDSSIEDLRELSEQINKRFASITEIHKKLYKEISDAKALSIDERKKFILFMLLEKETDRKGQSFEVTSYAILKAYYSIRGFELNRFSTIYSNDGGIDYTSQTSIYQVTTKMSDTKFDEDLLKAPLKQRIFVFKESVAGFDISRMSHELVSDYIDSKDLVEHLNYLIVKKPERNSSLILDILLKEFEREYYIDTILDK
jgi:hypothetical protein